MDYTGKTRSWFVAGFLGALMSWEPSWTTVPDKVIGIVPPIITRMILRGISIHANVFDILRTIHECQRDVPEFWFIGSHAGVLAFNLHNTYRFTNFSVLSCWTLRDSGRIW